MNMPKKVVSLVSPPPFCLSLGPADDRLYYSWKWHTQVLPLIAIQSEENLERIFCIFDLILF